MHLHRWLRSSIILATLTLFAPDASAHIKLISPTARDSGLKAGPCGTKGSVRGKNITTFKPGEKITVTWQETVSHPGHYRISFDDKGDDDFVDPKSFTDINTAPSVLVDNIADKTGTQMYTQEVTLPKVECDKCTLQLIQVMTDKAPYGDGNDLYYQCADLVISAGTTTSSSSSSSSSSSAASSSAAGGSTTSGEGTTASTGGSTGEGAGGDGEGGAGGGDSGAPGDGKGGCAFSDPGSSSGSSGIALLGLGLGLVTVGLRVRARRPRR